MPPAALSSAMSRWPHRVVGHFAFLTCGLIPQADLPPWLPKREHLKQFLHDGQGGGIMDATRYKSECMNAQQSKNGTNASHFASNEEPIADASPCGYPPTPLLPAWYREVFASTPLPPAIRSLAPDLSVIGDLGEFWKYVSSPVGASLLSELVASVMHEIPDADMVIVKESSLADATSRWPLRTRTRNCLRRWLRWADGDLTVGTALDIDCFGVSSLIDLMCVAEAVPLSVCELGEAEDTPTCDPPVSPPSVADVGWSEDRDAGGGYKVVRNLIASISAAITELNPTERSVLTLRMHPERQRTYREIAHEKGLSEGWVEQVGRRAIDRVAASSSLLAESVADPLRQQLEHITTHRRFHLSIDALFDNPECLDVRLARQLITLSLDYTRMGDAYLDSEAVQLIEGLHEHVSEMGDDYGIIKEDILRAWLPGTQWDPYWEALVAAAGFIRVGEYLARDSTYKTRIRAALYGIGRPATRDQIAERSGLESERLSYHLSVMSDVARAAKGRWAITEWIDSPYTSIANEMRKSIRQQGGGAALRRLASELSEQFGVSQGSVRAVASAPMFALENGRVSMAAKPELTPDSFEKGISGRDGSGVPYWDFWVTPRILKGFNLTGLPSGIAQALGCDPDQRTDVEVLIPRAVNELSVIWRLRSTGGPSVGRLTQPLRSLGARVGDQVRMVLNGNGSVNLQLVASVPSSG